MSVLSLTLAPYKTYAVVALLVAAVGGAAYYRHSLIEGGIRTGVAQQLAVDAAAKATLDLVVAAQTVALQKQADTAEHAHDKELSDLQAYRSAHPVSGAVRVCLASPANGSGSGLPKGSAGLAVNVGAGSVGVNIQQVPSGDPGVQSGAGPDIGNLLDLLAARGDQISAQLREYQARK